mmetsp:Transcript_2493/g.7390  ORF Transcript_2493/g.7390 Transcript_2493/m.7390 type:complete len:327 (-) Transcript_2493:263-1243(-)|eukprot:CAMPEP_0118860088 /NCGR_PEP_ID=MMETSP1163-20130328/6063_1 /TAXON_ID=124430 /ORGANISM="Phaeomonas parva, Strain CCMP2877" /LENGTH=326 /DNA_ID=CAMNT_0006793745 /DNA_START=150 /DNA_END=1130 /DNA_ORIENTATION=+
MSGAKEKPSGAVHLAAGVLAGIASTTLTHPLDLIKVRYQVHASRSLVYASVWDAFETIVRREGVQGLYQGLTPALIGSCVSWGGYFYFYEQAKQRRRFRPGQKLSNLEHLTAAVEASTIMVLITNPVWLIKTRLQLQRRRRDAAARPGTTGTTVGAASTTAAAGSSSSRPRPYKGFLDAAFRIVREEGVLGLYKGIGPALVLVSHGAFHFMVYEWMKERFKAKSAVDYLVMGALSKIVASIATYPYQVVKARLQSQRHRTDAAGRQTARYKGTMDCFRQMLRDEGARSLFKGVVPNAVRVAPSAAITFVTYELVVKALSQKKKQPI